MPEDRQGGTSNEYMILACITFNSSWKLQHHMRN